MTRNVIFTSESVTPGHPDKLCDQISDAAIDAFLRQDVAARAIVECAMATGIVFIAARFAARATVDLSALARTVIADAGYVGGGFDARTCSILTSITEEPEDTRAEDTSASDDTPAYEQANVFGFACTETPALMPLPIVLAHRLARNLAEVQMDGELGWLTTDGKTQVAVEYRDGAPARLRAMTLTTATTEKAPNLARLTEVFRERVIAPAFASAPLCPDNQTEIHVNPVARFNDGGPIRHAGLTGRKNGIDTYGEYARQSGSALSGKDPGRIDRIGAYAARHAAKNVVAAKLAERCEVHLAYSIGEARPVSLSVQTFGTARVDDGEIETRLMRVLDFRPASIERRFDLRRLPGRAGHAGFFRQLAVYGQVGRDDLDLPWERVDAAGALAD
ncbi:MAG: methionine adenosyltransferase [Alphaproteobacteria bacterium]